MKTQVAFKIRTAAPEDCRLLWEWANDPAVRAGAFSSDPIPWERHLDWFKGKQADPNCTLYILMDGQGHPLGQVRFDRQPDGSAETDISIARDYRGRGMGTQALGLACESFRESGKARRIVAFIKPENAPSLKAFEKAGFVRQGREWVKGQEAIVMSLP